VENNNDKTLDVEKLEKLWSDLRYDVTTYSLWFFFLLISVIFSYKITVETEKTALTADDIYQFYPFDG